MASSSPPPRASSVLLVVLLLRICQLIRGTADCRDEHGEWSWLHITLDGRAGKLCVSPTVMRMDENELLAASEDFCYQSQVNRTGCSLQVAAELMVATGAIDAITRLDLARSTAASLLTWSEDTAALDFLPSMLRLHPSDPLLTEYYGIALHRRGRAEEAVDQFKRLLVLLEDDGSRQQLEEEEERGGGSTSSSSRHKIALDLATVYMMQQDWQQALEWVDKAAAAAWGPGGDKGFLHLVRARALREVGGRTGEALQEAREAMIRLWAEGADEGVRQQAVALVRDMMDEHGPVREARYRDASSQGWGKAAAYTKGLGADVLFIGYVEEEQEEEEEATSSSSSSLPFVTSAASVNETVVLVHGLREVLQHLGDDGGSDGEADKQLVLVAPARLTVLLGDGAIIQQRYRQQMRERILVPAATTMMYDEENDKSPRPWSPTIYGEVGGGALVGEARDVRRVLLEVLKGRDGVSGGVGKGLSRLYWEQFAGRRRRPPPPPAEAGHQTAVSDGAELPVLSLDHSQDIFAVLSGHEPYTTHYRPQGDGRLENLVTESRPLVLLAHRRELQRLARDDVRLGPLHASSLLPSPPPPPPPPLPAKDGDSGCSGSLRFYLVEGEGSCQTLWTREMVSCLRQHPWRTSQRVDAHVVFLGSAVETAYEMNWPVYGAFGRGENWGRPGNDSHDRLCWRARNDEAALLSSWVPWRRLDQPLVVFDMHAGPQAYMMEDIIVAGSDLDEMTNHREGWDIGFPPMPHRVFLPTSGTEASCPEEVEGRGSFLLTFQGRATHELRLHMATLHNDEAGVIVRVICMYPGQSPVCVNQGLNARSIESEDATGYTYEDLLRHTSYSLVLRGDHAYSYRLLEVLSSGAIPVILSDRWVLPFHDLLDWPSFSLRLPEKDWSQVVDRVHGLHRQPGVTCRMRRAAREAYERCFIDMAHQLDCMLQVLDQRRRMGGSGDE